MLTHLRAAEHHLPYKITTPTQVNIPHLNLEQDGPVLDFPTPEVLVFY